MQVIVMYTPHWTIGKFKGRGMFVRRTSWGLQDWSSHCLNVLRWSDGPWYSSSSSCRTPGLPERSAPCNNWFPVRNRVSWGYLETVSKGGLGSNYRQLIRKVCFDGKRTFLTTPTHNGNWLYFQGNFRISSPEWKHAHPGTTSRAWLPRIIKKEVELPHHMCSWNHLGVQFWPCMTLLLFNVLRKVLQRWDDTGTLVLTVQQSALFNGLCYALKPNDINKKNDIG